MSYGQTNNYDAQFQGFFAGMRFFFAGLPLLFKHPRLLTLSLIPIVVTLVLLATLAFGCAWLIGRWLASWEDGGVRVLFQTLTFLLALWAGFTIYLPLARVLLAPFSEALSRKTRALTGGSLPTQAPPNWLRAMWEGAKLVGLQMLAALLALVTGAAFPPVGAFVWLAVAVAICGMDYLDVPLSGRGWSMRRKLAWWRHHLPTVLGFSVAAYLLLFIPFVNLLSLPVGVIGATLLTDKLRERY